MNNLFIKDWYLCIEKFEEYSDDFHTYKELIETKKYKVNKDWLFEEVKE